MSDSEIDLETIRDDAYVNERWMPGFARHINVLCNEVERLREDVCDLNSRLARIKEKYNRE